MYIFAVPGWLGQLRVCLWPQVMIQESRDRAPHRAPHSLGVCFSLSLCLCSYASLTHSVSPIDKIFNNNNKKSERDISPYLRESFHSSGYKQMIPLLVISVGIRKVWNTKGAHHLNLGVRSGFHRNCE